MASFRKIQLTALSHTFFIHFDFDFNLLFSFEMSGTFLADGVNSTLAKLDEIFYLIYILGWSR